MSSEDFKDYIEGLNCLTEEQIEEMISDGCCPYEPERLRSSLGMFECPLCGVEIKAGSPHSQKI
jgi:hypothetical protein